MRKYPYYKVIFGFLLCPIISTVLILFFALFYLDGFYNKDDPFLYFLAIISVVSLGSVFFYGVPAILVGVISSLLKLHKGFNEVLFLFFLGGCVAYAWGPLIEFLFPKNRVEPFPGLLWHSSVPFLLGASSSFLISLWVLPKKD